MSYQSPCQQWNAWYGGTGPLGVPDPQCCQNKYGYVAYGPLPADPINAVRYNPQGNLLYQAPNFYDPLAQLQPVPVYVPRRGPPLC